jgi:hypothetical protein
MRPIPEATKPPMIAARPRPGCVLPLVNDIMKLRAILLLSICFILLQGADFCLTRRLLARSDMMETNPLALTILTRHGWLGIALFKCACTAVTLAAAWLVCLSRARTAAKLLTAVCLLMAGVVGYSGFLLLRPDEQAAIRQQAAQTEKYLAEVRHFGACRDAICLDYQQGRLSLPDAVELMTRCLRQADRLPEALRRRLPPANRPELVAGYLLTHSALLMAQRAARQADVAGELLLVHEPVGHGLQPPFMPSVPDGVDVRSKKRVLK